LKKATYANQSRVANGSGAWLWTVTGAEGRAMARLVPGYPA
jgi:hypothetical protein